MYATAVEDLGLQEVHRHVGIEPSGLAFNEVSLNADNLPHNPMINAGAIAVGSCIKPGMDMAGRFKYFMDRVGALAGGEKIGFSQPTYLCEHETAWRNNALLYYMQEAGVFSGEVSPTAVLDFYIQCCAIEVNTQSASVIASTLANAGVCPLTDETCCTSATVKSTLTLMFSCGMYDYSGEWCVHVGLPAKSGVAGLVMIVIPVRLWFTAHRTPHALQPYAPPLLSLYLCPPFLLSSLSLLLSFSSSPFLSVSRTSWASPFFPHPWTPTATPCVASRLRSACCNGSLLVFLTTL